MNTIDLKNPFLFKVRYFVFIVLFVALLCVLFFLGFKVVDWHVAGTLFITVALLSAWILALFFNNYRQIKHRYADLQNQYTGFLNNVPLLMILKDREGRIINTNKTAQVFFGMNAESLTGKQEEDIFSDLQAQYFENNAFVYRKKEEKRGTIEIRTDSKNRERSLRTDRIPLFDPTGNFQGILFVAEDISDDIESNKKVRETAARLEKIIESLQEGVTLSTPEGYFEIYNSKMRSITGYSKDEANRTKDFINLIYPDPNQKMKVQDALESLMKTGRSHETISEIVSKDKQHKLILVSTVLVTFNDKIRFLSTYHDVSELFRIQEQMTLFSRAVEQGASMVLITDNNGFINYSNTKFSEITGYTRDEVMGQKIGFNDVIHAPDSGINVWNEIVENREWHGETESMRKNGDIYWKSTEISPITDQSGRITHFMVIENDITERRKMIQMLKNARDITESANRAKTEFLANMSHELRTPMNSIIGFTNILLKDSNNHFDSKEMMYLERIRDNGIGLLNILSDILEISMVESGKMSARYEHITLNSIISDLITQYNTLAVKKGLKFNTEIPETLKPFRTDPDKFHSIVDNLLSNAVKFTEKGGIDVIVHDDPNSGEPAEIIIKDTGPGIPEEQLESIFKAFEQVDYSKARKYGGTGLGLALANSYAELLNYKLIVDTKLHEGSVFLVRFY